MGFSYEIRGGSRLLVCESCEAVGGVRKVACPAGYCQADALCAGCRKSPDVKAKLKAAHAGCAEAHAKFAAREAAEAEALAAGEYVFCSAVGVTISEVRGVEMTFKCATGETVKKLVATVLYDAAMKAKRSGLGVVTLAEVESGEVYELAEAS